MSDKDMSEDLTEEQEGKKGDEEGKGKTGSSGKTEAMGSGTVQVSEGFYAYMNSVGATPAQIASVLKAWSHLTGKGLLKALKDFAGRKSRASAHAEVEIGKDKDYGLLHNFLDKLKSLRNNPEQNLTQQQKLDNRHRPGGPGSQGPSM